MIDLKRRMIDYLEIEQILKQFSQKVQGIRGLVLISNTGYPLTQAWGTDDSQAIILAGQMLQTAVLCQEDHQWDRVDRLLIRSKEGYLELIPCLETAYLLIYSTSQWSKSLEREIDLLLKQLQKQLEGRGEEAILVKKMGSNSQSTFELPVNLIEQYQKELAQYIGPIAPIVCRRLLNHSKALTPLEMITQLAQSIPSSQQANQFIESCLSLHTNSE